MAHENVIEMREITKVFGEFVANDKINLELRKGEILSLIHISEPTRLHKVSRMPSSA